MLQPDLLQYPILSHMTEVLSLGQLLSSSLHQQAGVTVLCSDEARLESNTKQQHSTPQHEAPGCVSLGCGLCLQVSTIALIKDKNTGYMHPAAGTTACNTLVCDHKLQAQRIGYDHCAEH